MGARKLYLVLLRLHPNGFRSGFADEMLGVFDEARETFGDTWLLREAALSVLRQRVLRVAVPAVPVRLGLLSGSYADLGPTHAATWLAVLLLVGLPTFFLIPPPRPLRHTTHVVKPEIRLEFSYYTPQHRVAKRRR
jgi:hypothetical protein